MPQVGVVHWQCSSTLTSVLVPGQLEAFISPPVVLLVQLHVMQRCIALLL